MRGTPLAGEYSWSPVPTAYRRSTLAYGLIQAPRACHSVKHVPLSTDRGRDNVPGIATIHGVACKLRMLAKIFRARLAVFASSIRAIQPRASHTRADRNAPR